MLKKIKKYIINEIVPWLVIALFIFAGVAFISFFIWLDKVRFIF